MRKAILLILAFIVISATFFEFGRIRAERRLGRSLVLKVEKLDGYFSVKHFHLSSPGYTLFEMTHEGFKVSAEYDTTSSDMVVLKATMYDKADTPLLEYTIRTKEKGTADRLFERGLLLPLEPTE